MDILLIGSGHGKRFKIAAIAAVLVAVMLYVRREVGPREAIQYEKVKTLAFRALDPITTERFNYPLVYRKTPVMDADHLATTEASLLTLARAFWAEGITWNPLSGEKYVEFGGARHYTALQVAYRDSAVDDDQTHFFVYRYDGALQIHGHHETSPADPEGHLEDKQVQGDPKDRLDPVLERLN